MPAKSFRSGTSLLLGALLFVAMPQQKGCDKSGPTAQAPAPTGEFDAAAAERTVRRQVEDLRLALESKQVTGVMRTIDPAGISGYAGFEDQITNLMESTAELRVNFRVASVQVRPAEGPDKPARAQVMADADLVYSLKANPAQPKRKATQLQMDLVQGEAGWRFVKIEPRNFFTP